MGQQKTLVYAHHTGGTNFRENEALINDGPDRTEMQLVLNMETYRQGGFQSQKGNRELLTNITDATEVLGIGEWIDSNENYHAVYQKASGKAYTMPISGADEGTAIHTGLNTSAVPQFIQYGERVVSVNGVDAMWFWDGTTLGNPSSPHASWASDQPHTLANKVAGRILAGAASTIYNNALGLINDWTTSNDAGSFTDVYNDVTDIVAIVEYGSRATIHTKKKRIYVMVGTNPSNYEISPIATNRAAVGRFCSANINDNQWFFAGDAILPVTTTELGAVQLGKNVDLATKISPFLTGEDTYGMEIDNLNQDTLSDCILLPYDAKNQLILYGKTGSNTTYDTAAIYNFDTNGWNFRQATPVTAAAIVGGKVITGTSDGRLLHEFNGDGLYDSGSFKREVIWPWLQFRQPTRLKTLYDVYLWFNSNTDLNVHLTFNIDYNEETAFETDVEINNVSSGAAYNVGSYGVDHYAATQVLFKRIEVNIMNFRQLRMSLRSNNDELDMRFIKCAFIYEENDDD